MKQLLVICLFSLFMFHAYGQNHSLTVTVKNIKSAEGKIDVALYNSENDFLKKMYVGKSVKTKAGEVKIVFDNIPAGSYAASVRHDANENNETDKNLVGIPKEGFGFSNDAMGTFGPPDFDKAKFDVKTGDVAITINLKYY